jgi:hypothetical protein
MADIEAQIRSGLAGHFGARFNVGLPDRVKMQLVLRGEAPGRASTAAAQRVERELRTFRKASAHPAHLVRPGTS